MRNTLQNDIELVSSALEQVEDSICLKRMLEVVLALGNYLNGGTVRGGAHGFKLETLLKLQSIKSTDNQITLLNYLAELLSSDSESSYVIEDLAEELNKLGPSTRIGLPMLADAAARIRKGLRRVERQLRDLAGHEEEVRTRPVVARPRGRLWLLLARMLASLLRSPCSSADCAVEHLPFLATLSVTDDVCFAFHRTIFRVTTS